MLIDTHAHLNFAAFKDDADEVIRRSLDNDVWMINVGSQYTTSKRAVEIAEKYSEGVFAAIGLHPIHLSDGIFKTKIDKEEIEFQTREEEFDCEKYRELAKSKKVVAIGEIGFDYYYKPKTKRKLELFKEKQRIVFCQQLELAQELDLPVIFHCRMAHQDLLEILKSKIQNPKGPSRKQAAKIRGVIHCYTGNEEETKQYLDMGFYLGFNGLIFKLDFDEIIKKTPLERILIETDCPYLIPLLPAEALAKAGPKNNRNEPLYVKYVAEKIAQIKNLSYEEIAKITTKNAKNLFYL